MSRLIAVDTFAKSGYLPVIPALSAYTFDVNQDAPGAPERSDAAAKQRVRAASRSAHAIKRRKMASEQAMMAIELPKVTVHILRGKASRNSREMRGASLLIGSDPGCDIQMRSLDVADSHCLIQRHPDQVTVRQLTADFPVLVNGGPVTESEVSDGDVVTIGPFELRLGIDGVGGHAFTPTSLEQNNNLSVDPASTDDDLAFKNSLKDSLHSSESSAPPQHRPSDTRPASPHHKSAVFDRLGMSSPRPEEVRAVDATRKPVQTAFETNDAAPMRQRIQREKDALVRSYKEQAQREHELSEKARQIERAKSDLHTSRQQLEHERMAITEELLAVDRKRKTAEDYKRKLIRVRTNLFKQYRSRRQYVGDLLTKLEKRAAELREREDLVEQANERLRSVRLETEQREADLDRREGELTATKARLKEENAALAGRRRQLEQDLQNYQNQQYVLESLRQELEQRRAGVEAAEAASRQLQEKAQSELSLVQDKSFQADQRLKELEERSLKLDAQQERLNQLGDALETRRKAHTEKEEQAEHRAASLAEQELSLHRQREVLKSQQEQSAAAEADLALKRSELDKSYEELARQRTQLDQRAAELDAEKLRNANELKAQRHHFDAVREELESEQQRLEEMRRQIDADRDKWAAEVCTVQERQMDVAQLEGIVWERQHRLDDREVQQRADRDSVAQRERTVAADRELLQQERARLEECVREARLKQSHLNAEMKQLQQQDVQHQQRLEELTKREASWCEDVKRRRKELEAQHAELNEMQQTLDRQSRTHRRQVAKLRQIGVKVAQRRKEAFELTRQLGGLPGEASGQSTQRLWEMLQACVADSAERERATARWLDGVQAAVENLASSQNQLGAQLRNLADDKGTELEGALVAWESRFELVRDSLKQPVFEPVDVHPGESSTGAEKRDVEANFVPKPGARRPPQDDDADVRLQGANDGENHSQTTNESPAPKTTRNEDSDLKVYPAAQQSQAVEFFETVVSPSYSAPDQSEPSAPAVVSEPNQADREHIGDLLVVGAIHHGSVATTFRVRKPDSPTDLALRLLDKRWCRDRGLLKSYEIAVEPLSQLRHPHVVSVEGLFATKDQYGLLMEYVDGASLRELARHPIPAPVLVHQFCQALRGLAAAHRSGFVHGSLRPSRVLVDRSGTVRLTGYGEPLWLTKIQRCERRSEITKYVAPEELVLGQSCDIRSDLYSLARLFTEIALGQVPAAGEAVELSNHYPAEFGRLLTKLTRESPSQRYPSAAEAGEVAEQIVDRMGVHGAWSELPQIIASVHRGESGATRAA